MFLLFKILEELDTHEYEVDDQLLRIVFQIVLHISGKQQINQSVSFYVVKLRKRSHIDIDEYKLLLLQLFLDLPPDVLPVRLLPSPGARVPVLAAAGLLPVQLVG